MKERVINTIRGQVYELIKAGICDGQYKPGQWLQEKELANYFSVSRSPVREALRQLASEGFVVDIPNKGTFVRKFTVKDIEEIYDLRVLLENYALTKASGRLDSQKVEGLRDCIRKMSEAYTDEDLVLYTKYDQELHDLLIRLSGNDLLIDTYTRLCSSFQQFRVYSLSSQQRLEQSLTEHTAIVNDLLNGNVEEAQATNQIHMSLAREQIIDYMEQLNDKNCSCV